MDKFVQLPLFIPPSMPQKVKDYAIGLIKEYEKSDTPRKVLDTNVGKTTTTHTQEDTIKADQVKMMDEMDQKIKGISDLDKEFLDQVSEAASDFSNNPRDIKRFMNLFRFYRFLAARSDKPERAPSFGQLRRWTIMSLKWPQVVRWLYYSPSDTGYTINQDNTVSRERLEMLENIGKESQDHNEWKKRLREEFGLTEDDNSIKWINDKNLFEFFRRELTQYSSEPLSVGAGQGLY